MVATEVKERLHSYIELASDEKLNAIYTLLENDIELNERIEFDKERDMMLEERREEYLSGKVIGMTAEESLDYIRHQLNKNGL